MRFSKLETPCLILDRQKALRNIGRMRKVLAGKVALRFHGKSAKSIDVLKLVLKGREGGIAVSTLKEAEYYFECGVKDIIYAVGLSPNKLDRVRRLVNRGAKLKCILDSKDQARFIAAYAERTGLKLPLLIEIDSDGHRSGVQPDSKDLTEIARLILGSKHLSFAGVLTHAGGSYDCESIDAIRKLAILEKEQLVRCTEKLGSNSIACSIVSIGSTPTALFSSDLNGITEVRAGNFVFFDLFMVGLGVCTIEEIALSILTSVIGHQKEKNWIITDSGWMALSRDRGTMKQKGDRGYGVVCDESGKPLGDLIVTAANQEHGIIRSQSGLPVDLAEFPVGRLLRILPNHACATSAMHDKYHVVDGGDEISAVWPRINGW